jgi:phosphoenolpyruvate carboxylase
VGFTRYDASPGALLEDPSLIEDTLVEMGCARLGSQFVQPQRRKLDVFGFHLASLDGRQNSIVRFMVKPPSNSLLKDGESFSDWSENKRVAFLGAELESSCLLLHACQSARARADAIRDCYRVLATHHTAGHGGIGALILGMTLKVSDLLLVHLFARYVFAIFESSIASSNHDFMHAYANFVNDDHVRNRSMTLIEAEHALMQKHLTAIFYLPLVERRPRFTKTLALSEASLKKLHYQ